MTVLQRKERGADPGQLGRILGTMLVVGLIAAAAVYGISRIDGTETATPSQVLSPAELAQLDQLNKADIGVPAPSAGTFEPSLHVPGAAWSTFQGLHVPGAPHSAAGASSTADAIAKWPSSSMFVPVGEATSPSDVYGTFEPR